jgi:hypothetical protein
MTNAAVGFSLDPDPIRAAQDVMRSVQSQLSESEADLLLVFATAGYDQQVLLGALRTQSHARLVGCSAEGIITGAGSNECDHAVTVMALQSNTLAFEPFLVEGFTEDSARVGAVVGGLIAARPDTFGVLLFPDGLGGDCSAFLEAVEESRGTVRPTIVGGAAADGLLLEHTYQYLDHRIVSGGVSGVLLRGPGTLDVVVGHGCTPLGNPLTITRATESWLEELDGQSAWHALEGYLEGDTNDLHIEQLNHICFGELLPAEEAKGYAPYIIRTPLGLRKENGALSLPGGGLELGKTFRVVRRDPLLIRQRNAECARELANRHAHPPKAVMQFDCAGRGKLLFGSAATAELVTPLQSALGGNPPWIGFHTYGELAPLAGKVRYHNLSVALCGLYDIE